MGKSQDSLDSGSRRHLSPQNNTSLLGERIGEFLFKGVLYILYGRRAGETREEKIARVSLIIWSLVIVFLVLSMLVSLIRGRLFVERVAPAPIEWGVPIEQEILPEREMPLPPGREMPPVPPWEEMPLPKVP